jgi:hypothetical protein
MTDKDINRSNDSGTGAKTLDRDEFPTPPQGGSSGGHLQREIGSMDEEQTATGADPHPTSVQKGQKPRDGDQPNLPNRAQNREERDEAPPRRT